MHTFQVHSKRLEQDGAKGKLVSYKCDVGKEDEVEVMFQWIEEKYGGVDVCVNNAGVAVTETLLGKLSTSVCKPELRHAISLPQLIFGVHFTESNPAHIRDMFNVSLIWNDMWV